MFENVGIVNGDMFIIPNGIVPNLNSFLESTKKEFLNFGQLNNLNNIDQEKFIQVWITVKGKTDNLLCNGIVMLDDCGIKHYCTTRISHVPVNMVCNKKEGDTIKLVLPFYDEESHEKFNATFNIKLNQTSYRYRRFGKFEECLRLLRE